MKKIIAVLLMAVMLCGCSSADAKETIQNTSTTEETTNDYAFRNTNWGMTVEEVVDSETSKPTSYNENVCHFTDVLVNDEIKMDLIYNFKDGKLANAFYIEDTTIEWYPSCKSKFDALLIDLISQYGSPSTTDGTLPITSPKGSDEFSAGRSWEVDNTRILLLMSKDSDTNEITLFINYEESK